METKFQTSFIPKKNVGGNEVYSYRAPLGLFLVIAICLAGLSVLLAAGTFVYKGILNRQIASKEADLEQKDADLQSSEIDNLVRVGDKIDSAETLLNSHIAVTPIFALLQQNTLKRLQFTELEYTYLSSNKIAISMKGVAKDFGVIARQSDAFSEVTGSKFTSPLFSDLDTDDKGNATFSFLTTVDPNLVLYKNNLPAINAETTGTTDVPTSTATGTAF